VAPFPFGFKLGSPRLLKQACVADLKAGRFSRADGYIVLVMRRYPRGVSKKVRDEYLSCLGPEAGLLNDLHAQKEASPHNEAFDRAAYESRFDLTNEGRDALKRLADLSVTRDVYLICQCGPEQKCHRELLLAMAEKWYNARVAERRFEYPEFERRIVIKGSSSPHPLSCTSQPSHEGDR